MGICKDCLHYKACKMTYLATGGHGDDTFDEFNWVTIFGCDNFADKSEWVHLPCKVGDTVYYITGIHGTLIKPATIEEIIINENGIQDLFVSTDNCSFENSFDNFYLTKQEAEKALAERKKK